FARAKNPLITLRQTDGINIPYEDGCFDLVTQFVVFSAMPSAALRTQVAGEMSRVVKPGGFVFWWDLLTLPSADLNKSLCPSDYFHWPVREFAVGKLPRPSECFQHPERQGTFHRWFGPFGPSGDPHRSSHRTETSNFSD